MLFSSFPVTIMAWLMIKKKLFLKHCEARHSFGNSECLSWAWLSSLWSVASLLVSVCNPKASLTGHQPSNHIHHPKRACPNKALKRWHLTTGIRPPKWGILVSPGILAQKHTITYVCFPITWSGTDWLSSKFSYCQSTQPLDSGVYPAGQIHFQILKSWDVGLKKT